MTRPLLIVESASQVHYYEPQTSDVWVAHSNTWQRPDDPIFHRIRELEDRTATAEGDRTRRGWDIKTGCGATVSATSWLEGPARWETSDYRSSDYGIRLPIRWALQFARPCRRCWP